MGMGPRPGGCQRALLGSHGPELVDLDREVSRPAVQEGVTVDESLGRVDVRGLDDGVTVEVTGAIGSTIARNRGAAAGEGRTNIDERVANLAHPGIPGLHEPRAQLGGDVCRGCCGALVQKDELCHDMLLFFVVMDGNSSGRVSTREGYESLEDVDVGSNLDGVGE